jgi:hypothetical protein
MAERKNFVLRIDPALWAEIERWASEELRSINGQIEYLLRQAVVTRRKKELKESPADESQSRNQKSE